MTKRVGCWALTFPLGLYFSTALFSVALLVKLMASFAYTLVEVFGIIVGSVLYRMPLPGRIMVGLAVALLTLYHADDQSWVFFSAVAALVVFECLALPRLGVSREPHSILLVPKNVASIAVFAAVWDRSWLSAFFALLAFHWARKFFFHLREGLTLGRVRVFQEKKDANAARLYAKLSSKGSAYEPIAVYLRPFEVSGLLKVPDGEFEDAIGGGTEFYADQDGEPIGQSSRVLSIHLGVTETMSHFERNVELEYLINGALQDFGHVLAIGKTDSGLGPGKLVTDEMNWKNVAKSLIDSCSICAIVPSARPGTLWEIQYIVASGQLEKCCFFMPSATGQIDYSARWEAVRKAVQGKVSLPPYHPNGAVFRITADGSVAFSHPDESQRDPVQALSRRISLLFPHLGIPAAK